MTRFVALGDVAEVNPGVPPELRSADPDKQVPFLPMAVVSEQGAPSYVEQRRLADVLKGFTCFAKGDVILAKITPCFENGKAAYLHDLPGDVGFGSTEFHVLRPGPEVDGLYLFHAIWNPEFRVRGQANMTGTAGQKRVPTSYLRAVKIPLPPLAEQRRIAGVLDRVEGVRGRMAERQLQIRALREAAFIGMFGDPALNPQAWSIVSLNDLIVDSQYGTSVRANPDGRGLPILRMNNLTVDGSIRLEELKWCEIPDRDRLKYTVRRGDLLFNRTNSPELVGKTALWQSDDLYAFAGYLIRVRFDEASVLPTYVSAYLNSRHGKRVLLAHAKPSINMSNISASALGRLPIAVPPLRLQHMYQAIERRIEDLLIRCGQSAQLGARVSHSLTSAAFASR